MKVGDLVRFRRCSQQGKVGVIVEACKPSGVTEGNVLLQLFWVAYSNQTQCFTGSQLELI
jgi:hypothetical protein